MFNTLAYCLGLTTSTITPDKEVQDVSFSTKETDDQWTIVDLDNKNKGMFKVTLLKASLLCDAVLLLK